MIDKLIIDGAQIELDEKTTLPYTYQFSTAKTHIVKYALSDTDEISAGAFANCSYMTKVKFPPQIEMIKRRAFENCVRLNNVVIPKTIKYIGANVWNGCTGMTEIHFEGTTPPENFAEIPAGCEVFIPNDSKYAPVEKDADGNNINMNPDTVVYYTKTEYNLYQEVPAKLLDKTTQYYYDKWTGIAPNNVTVEEQNRIPITSVDFSQSTIRTTVGSKLTLTHDVKPANATNKRLHYFSDSDEIVIADTNVLGEVMIDCGDIPATANITIYAESGVSSKCQIRTVRG